MGGHIPDITAHDDVPLKTCDHCLAQIICNPPQPACYLGTCTSCPGISALKDRLTTLMDENLIDEVVYKQLVSVDRTTLETISLLPSCWLFRWFLVWEAGSTSSTLVYRKTAVFFPSETEDRVETGGDSWLFWELLLCVTSAVQGFHWNNAQATIHPCVVYYRDSDELCHISFVIILDCLHHNTVGVHLFQKSLMDYLKENHGSVLLLFRWCSITVQKCWVLCKEMWEVGHKLSSTDIKVQKSKEFH